MNNKIAAVEDPGGASSGVDIGTTFFGEQSKLTSLTGIGDIVTIFLRGAFSLAGLILLYTFIMAGIGMMRAGKDDPKQAEQAKAAATSSIIGFVVVFTSYWIVKLIGNLLGITLV